MLNKKKNNKQEKLKQTRRAGLIFFTSMLVLFAGLTLVACPDGSTESSSNGDQGSSTLTGTLSYTDISAVEGIASSHSPSWTGAPVAQTVSYSLSPSVAGITIDSNTGVITVSGTVAIMASTGFTVTATGTGNYAGPVTATANIAVLTAYDYWTTEHNGGLTQNTTGTKITTAQELKDIAKDTTSLAGEYYLGNDIDISGAAWTPIGSKDSPFTGKLHGNGYAITGLTIGDAAITPVADGTADYQGLFGVIDGATIDNLFIEVTHIYANAVVGALAGMVRSTDSGTVANPNYSTSTLTNIAVSGMSTSALIQAKGGAIPPDTLDQNTYLGGVVGYMTAYTGSRHTISAYNYGLRVTANNSVGGLVGKARMSDIIGYATGAVSGTDLVGGLVSSALNSTVSGYATGAVSGTERVGGLVGSALNSTVSGYARGTVTRTSGANVTFGMLVGQNNGATISGFHSATESMLLDSNGAALTGATGVDGTAITMGPSITQADFAPATGDTLTFGTAVGEWKWVANGQWPAINIGLR